MWQTLYQAWEPNPKPKPMEFNFKECSIDPRFPYTKLLGLKREKVGWVFRIQNPFTKTQLTGVAGRSMTQRGNERRIPHKCPDYAADALRHPRRGEPRQSQSGGGQLPVLRGISLPPWTALLTDLQLPDPNYPSHPTNLKNVHCFIEVGSTRHFNS